MRRYPPERIMCLTEGMVETLYQLIPEDRIAGVSGYAVPPSGTACHRSQPGRGVPVTGTPGQVGHIGCRGRRRRSIERNAPFLSHDMLRS